LNAALRASYRFCDQLARREARNFYYAFLLLPPSSRRSMCALYAFMRHSDDLADEPAGALDPHTAMAAWHADVQSALSGGPPSAWPGLAALADTVARHQIPVRYLEEVLEGVTSVLEPKPFATFADLYAYCYQVASAVGLCCLHIWGYESRGGQAEALAEACGIALQLTNIVRDVRTDAVAGRVYLPREDLERFGVSATELAGSDRPSEACRALLAFECQRARDHFNQAAPLVGLIRPIGRPVFATIFGIYRALLDEIVKRDYDVFTTRVALPGLRKTGIALKSLSWRFARPAPVANHVKTATPPARGRANV
jgi:phytoene synthase